MVPGGVMVMVVGGNRNRGDLAEGMWVNRGWF